MALGLTARHLGRYKDLVLLFTRYALKDFQFRSDAAAEFPGEDRPLEPDVQARARAFAESLKGMGPAYIKFGQVLSTRPDLVPPEYIAALESFQDKLEPFSFDEVEEIVKEQLGVRLSQAFRVFEPVPLAAASLGQVHRATLRGDRPVVVKVQRPGVRQQVLADMETLSSVAEKLDAHTDIGRRYGLGDLLEQFRRSLMDELDYRREADNMQRVGEMLSDHPMIVVPSPHLDFTTGKVLTMDYVPGQKITELGPLVRVEMDLEPLADDLFAAYLEQVLVQGTFHADPHPGNVLLTPDGRLVLLDIGMMARLTPATRGKLVKLFLALADARPDEVARISRTMGEELADFEPREFDRTVADIVGRSADASLAEQPIGALVLELTRRAAECGLKMDPELVMLGKTLLNLDQVATALDPEFAPREALKRHVSELMKSSMGTTPASLLSSMLEAKEFVEELPGRVNRAFDAVGSGSFELRVNAFDEDEFLRGLHKLANVVATAVILGSMILSSALLARSTDGSTNSGQKIALVVFVVSVVLSLGMLARTVLKSRGVRSHRGE